MIDYRAKGFEPLGAAPRGVWPGAERVLGHERFQFKLIPDALRQRRQAGPGFPRQSCFVVGQPLRRGRWPQRIGERRELALLPGPVLLPGRLLTRRPLTLGLVMGQFGLRVDGPL